MTRIIFEYSVIPFGALICCVFKGFKNTFDEQYNDKNYHINSVVGSISVFILIGTTAIIATFC